MIKTDSFNKHGRKRIFPLKLITPCNHRFKVDCPVCAKRWRAKHFNRFSKAINDFQDPRFLTLTLKYDTEVEFDERIRELWKYRKELFHRLRKKRKDRPAYKIKAWIAVIEFPNHIHLVFDGVYIPWMELVKEWNNITGDSRGVFIERVNKDRQTVSSYLSKYLSKITCYEALMADKLRGFHLYQTSKLGDVKKKLFFEYHGYTVGQYGWLRCEYEEYEDLKERWKREPERLV